MRLSFFFKKLTLCHDMKKIYTVDKTYHTMKLNYLKNYNEAVHLREE